MPRCMIVGKSFRVLGQAVDKVLLDIKNCFLSWINELSLIKFF